MAGGKPGRGSDQFPLRFPDGMRDHLKAAAEANNRSMNAEIIARLEESFREDVEMLSEEGWKQISKRLSAATEATESIFFFARDVDLDGYIYDQALSGNIMERTEAVRHIITEYLKGAGYVFEPPTRRRGLVGIEGNHRASISKEYPPVEVAETYEKDEQASKAVRTFKEMAKDMDEFDLSGVAAALRAGDVEGAVKSLLTAIKPKAEEDAETFNHRTNK